MQQILLVAFALLSPHMSGDVPPTLCHLCWSLGLTQPGFLPMCLSSHWHLWKA